MRKRKKGKKKRGASGESNLGESNLKNSKKIIPSSGASTTLLHRIRFRISLIETLTRASRLGEVLTRWENLLGEPEYPEKPVPQPQWKASPTEAD